MGIVNTAYGQVQLLATDVHLLAVDGIDVNPQAPPGSEKFLTLVPTYPQFDRTTPARHTWARTLFSQLHQGLVLSILWWWMEKHKGKREPFD